MKKLLLLLPAITLFVLAGCRKSENGPAQEPAIPASLDAFIASKLQEKGEFLWDWASDDQIRVALEHSDYVMSVGYQPAGENNVADRLHLINIQDPAWQAARNAVLAMILEQERRINPNLQASDLLAFDENGILPVMNVYIRNEQTIQALRQSGLVRYAEPCGYEPNMQDGAIDRSGSGCDSNNPEPGLINGVHYTVIAPDCKRSWNYSFHNISQAWENSTGSGAKVVIIDTGCSDDQENLGEDFNQGQSSGRSIQKYVTLPPSGGNPETPNDQCGHGTSMQGACAAPRGTDGNTVGVAYNCNLASYRAAADVYLNESREVVGVSDAFTQAGNDANTRIISMSMGRLTTSNQIRDAIKYAYGKGKMIFAAAGTSFWWTSWFVGVIFPATMTECIAVTGVKDNLTARCSDCHSGSKVDFVLVMERVSDGKNPLSLPDAGDDPSMVGGSSVATASTAGIAALVWAKYPGWTRTQVYDRLKNSSSNASNRHPQFGWGRINAQTATN